MDYFLWFIVILIGFGLLGQIGWLSKDEFPERTKHTVIWNVFMNLIIVIWAINLLIYD